MDYWMTLNWITFNDVASMHPFSRKFSKRWKRCSSKISRMASSTMPWHWKAFYFCIVCSFNGAEMKRPGLCSVDSGTMTRSKCPKSICSLFSKYRQAAVRSYRIADNNSSRCSLSVATVMRMERCRPKRWKHCSVHARRYHGHQRPTCDARSRLMKKVGSHCTAGCADGHCRRLSICPAHWSISPIWDSMCTKMNHNWPQSNWRERDAWIWRKSRAVERCTCATLSGQRIRAKPHCAEPSSPTIWNDYWTAIFAVAAIIASIRFRFMGRRNI